MAVVLGLGMVTGSIALPACGDDAGASGTANLEIQPANGTAFKTSLNKANCRYYNTQTRPSKEAGAPDEIFGGLRSTDGYATLTVLGQIQDGTLESPRAYVEIIDIPLGTATAAAPFTRTDKTSDDLKDRGDSVARTAPRKLNRVGVMVGESGKKEWVVPSRTDIAAQCETKVTELTESHAAGSVTCTNVARMDTTKKNLADVTERSSVALSFDCPVIVQEIK
ncbi:MAG: hypothetical protein U0169_24285 [Polyangiaceae bacterium]